MVVAARIRLPGYKEDEMRRLIATIGGLALLCGALAGAALLTPAIAQIRFEVASIHPSHPGLGPGGFQNTVQRRQL